MMRTSRQESNKAVLFDFLLLTDFGYVNSVYVVSAEMPVHVSPWISLGFLKHSLQGPSSDARKFLGAEQHMGK